MPEDERTPLGLDDRLPDQPEGLGQGILLIGLAGALVAEQEQLALLDQRAQQFAQPGADLDLGGVSVEAFPRWLFEQPLTGSATYDPPSLADGATTTTTITVNGARVGDVAEVSAPYSLSGIIATAYVNTPNVVTVLLNNESGGTVDLGSGTWRAAVQPTT